MPIAPPIHRPRRHASLQVDRKLLDARRPNANARGYDWSWSKARTDFLGRYPLCADCLKAGDVTAATVVDHIIPHRGDKRLFWDRANWQALCETCHNSKTGRGL